MPRTNAEPFAPRTQDRYVPAETPAMFISNWNDKAIFSFPKIGVGWTSVDELVQNGSLIVFDMDGTATPVTDKAAIIGTDKEKALDLLHASTEGRLCFKVKDSGDLLQIQTEIDRTNQTCTVSISRPVKTFANLDPTVPEPEEILPMPEKPGLWTRFVAFFFRNSAAAETVRQYHNDLEAYNAQQQRLNAKEESKKEAPKKEETAPKKEETSSKLEVPDDPDIEVYLRNLAKAGKSQEYQLSMVWSSDPPKTVPELNTMVLGRLHGMLAQEYLDAASASPEKSGYLKSNEKTIRASLNSMKEYLHSVSNNEDEGYGKIIQGLADPAKPGAEKMQLGQELNNFFKKRLQLFQNAMAHAVHESPAEKLDDPMHTLSSPQRGGLVSGK